MNAVLLMVVVGVNMIGVAAWLMAGGDWFPWCLASSGLALTINAVLINDERRRDQ